MELYLSLSAYGGVSTRQALTVFAEAGVQKVELAIGVKPDADASIAIQAFRQQGMQFRAHHAFVWESQHRPFNLALPMKMDYFERMADWLAEQAITAYSVHPGHYRGGPETAWQLFLANLEKLDAICKQRRIELAVETMYDSSKESEKRYFLDCLDSNQEPRRKRTRYETAPFWFLQTPQGVGNEPLTAIQALRSAMPDLKWVLDLSHLNIGWDDRVEERFKVIDCIANRLSEIHVSDNDGQRDLHSRITDDTWWIPWLDRLPTDIPIVLETRLNHLPATAIRAEYERVRSVLSVGLSVHYTEKVAR
jgi:sugar phosphate isomerase/epimerase